MLTGQASSPRSRGSSHFPDSTDHNRGSSSQVLVERTDEFFDFVEVPAPNELQLQDVMKMHPQLIPADDLGLDGDLLVVGRETIVASGRIAHARGPRGREVGAIGGRAPGILPQ